MLGPIHGIVTHQFYGAIYDTVIWVIRARKGIRGWNLTNIRDATADWSSPMLEIRTLIVQECFYTDKKNLQVVYSESPAELHCDARWC